MAIKDVIVAISGMGAFDDVEHPVFMAFSWIVSDDPMRLCPDDENLPQRYALVLLYFATFGDDWNKCTRDGGTPCTGAKFLSGHHECDWGGVTCDSLDRVIKINLGKSAQSFSAQVNHSTKGVWLTSKLLISMLLRCHNRFV